MADTTNASLTSQGIRLECLRLAQRPDRDAEWITKRAAEFELFVVGPDEPPADASHVEAPAAQQTDKPSARARSKSS